MDIYRAVHFGQSVGIGVSQSIFLHLSAVGKCNSAGAPYVVANELVAAQIGLFLKLPLPPGCLIVDPNGAPFYASLDFNLTGNTLPPIIPNQFTAQFGPSAIAAIIAFDILIANSDRHAGNLSADYGAAPPRYNVFDHSHCLWSGAPQHQQGEARLNAAAGLLVVDGAQGGNRHCLAGELTDDRPFSGILDRIGQLPNFFIDETVDAARDYGVSLPEAVAMKAFLRNRRDNIAALIAENKAAFPNVGQWSLI
jgi:hypothetical protein